jgi:TPR repeat protein
LFILSDEQGDAMVQGFLGRMYDKGQGVPQDYKEAVKWYRLSAEQGDAMAQGFLGMMYDKGQGVPQDYVQAYAWLNVATSQGEDFAAASRQRVMGNMTPAQIEEGQQLSREYAKKYIKE